MFVLYCDFDTDGEKMHLVGKKIISKYHEVQNYLCIMV